MVDAEAGVSGVAVAEDAPEGPGGGVGVEASECVGSAAVEQAGELGAGFGLDEGVFGPGAFVVDVGCGGDDVEVAGGVRARMATPFQLFWPIQAAW